MQGIVLGSFLSVWDNLMELLTVALFVVSAIVYIVYEIRLVSITDPRKKYNFISDHEITFLRWVFYLLSFGVATFINLYGAGEIDEMGVWFFVRLFASIGGATLVVYIASVILKYQYSAVLSRKLRRWRYKPRINPDTGSKMRLVDKSEDIVRLHTRGQPKGRVHSMDYDVWIDVSSGDSKVEEYDSWRAYLLCHNCGHNTMRVVDEELVDTEDGKEANELLRHYRCLFCKNVRATQFYISTKTDEDYKNYHREEMSHTQDISSVKIEIQSVSLGHKLYEFDSLQKARQFLHGYKSN